MKQYKISVIIRTYNEEKRIDEVLDILSRQTYKNSEIIIVDSESTDNTLEICRKYDTKIITINKNDFNYSYASNIGAENATGEILCYLSGHSVPNDIDYLEKMNEIFQDKSVGGCYGEIIALEDGSWVEKVYHYLGYIKNINKIKKVVYEKEIHPGILSCSNASVRKKIWSKNKFKEELGMGGEDVELAYRIIKEGYVIAKVPYLLVKHSHGSNLVKFINEFKAWRKMYNMVDEYINNNP